MKLDRLWHLLLTSAMLFQSHCVNALLLGTPAKGEVVGENISEVNNNIPQRSEIELPATSAQMLVQSTPTNPPATPGEVVSITGVQINPTDKGVEVILQTTQGKVLQPVTLALGRTSIANIPNAVLALPQGGEFRQDNPASGITRVRVTQASANSIRVTVTGEAAVPQVELYDSPDEGLIFSFTPGASTAQSTAEDEQIEILVTGEQDEGYNPSSATTATRTDTPLRDIPQSIQVVPQEVLRDRNVRTVGEAVETVSGVIDTSSTSSPIFPSFSIRGFADDRASVFRNGFRDDSATGVFPLGTIERVEVLKGPASVLFGSIEPGGLINLITRQPLDEPYYQLGFEAGSFGRYQPSLDFSGPLTADESILYRFIAAYSSGGGFQDRVQDQTTTIAPSLTFRIGDQTTLNLSYEYARFYADPPLAGVPLLSDGSLPPRSFYPNYFSTLDFTTQRASYTLNHEFNDNWRIRNSFSAIFTDTLTQESFATGISEDRFLTGQTYLTLEGAGDTYQGQIDLVGEFRTGSISHQLLAGFDFYRTVFYDAFADNTEDENSETLPDLDIFDPDYDIPRPRFPSPSYDFQGISQSYGVYLQDQITISDNLKMLIGGRYDWLHDESNPLDGGERSSQNNGAFSPRIGLVYQPSQNISLYTSYSQSFRPSIGRNPDNEVFEPTRGTQYEVGVKTHFLDGRLSTTLAAYNITRTNVLTPDPDPILAEQGFQVQVGEQRSRGIELDVAGEILPGWNIIVSYALTDAEVTEDNSIPSRVDNRPGNVPLHQASLWTTYEIQRGDLQGLGFGGGLLYVGERQGDLANSFQVGDYLRTDAALYYRRGGFKAAINVNNLFDINYIRAARNASYVTPGEPLTITGSVSWEF